MVVGVLVYFWVGAKKDHTFLVGRATYAMKFGWAYGAGLTLGLSYLLQDILPRGKCSHVFWWGASRATLGVFQTNTGGGASYMRRCLVKKEGEKGSRDIPRMGDVH